MKKKIGSVLLILALLIALVPTVLFQARAETLSGSCGKHASWTLNRSTGALVITGTGEIEGETDPYTTSREDLPGIRYGWETYRQEIRTVSIGSGITGIGMDAFRACGKLRSVVLPSSVSVIHSRAFEGCTALSLIVIPNRNCVIYGNSSNFASTAVTVIYGFKNTTAKTFAQRYGYRFSPLPDDYGSPNPFVDVPTGSFYHDAVLWAVNETPQITNGTDAVRFSPGKTCTRAEAVTLLWRAKKQPSSSGTTNPFTDVKSSAFYAKAVLWAVKAGVTTGTDKTHFSPDLPCTRAQVVTFLWRACGKPEPTSTNNPFRDVPDGYYKKAVLWAVEKGITKGTGATTFSPDQVCTRGEIVTFLYRAFQR